MDTLLVVPLKKNSIPYTMHFEVKVHVMVRSVTMVRTAGYSLKKPI
jgi:hypothetical protein